MADILVVVTCRDNGRTLERALEDLREQGRPDASCVVLDFGSTDLYTRALLGKLRCGGVPVHDGGDGAHPLFTSAAGAQPDYVMVMRGDTRLSPGFLAAAAKCLDDDDSGCHFVWGTPSFPATSNGAPRPASLVELLAWAIVPSVELMRRAEWEEMGALGGTRPPTLVRCVQTLASGRSGVVLPGASHPEARALGTSDGLETMSRIYAKQMDMIAPVGSELLAAKRAGLAALRQELAVALTEQTALEEEFHDLGASIERLATDLRGRGLPRIAWGELRRSGPFSPFWGGERGQPINRHYIEQFLRQHAGDITGRVLEIKDPGYTRMFGTSVMHEDVLDIDVGNPVATITADLRDADRIPDDIYDCVILTQVLNIIDNVPAALRHVLRILRPGGVMLCTVAALDRVSYEDQAADGDFWRFTEASVRLRLSEVCPPESTEVVSYGNVMTCVAHLYGLAVHELDLAELDQRDPDFPLIIAVRAVKPGSLDA